jgi:predicted AlkP superfamily pyrophosphatase or phosphodiesterase
LTGKLPRDHGHFSFFRYAPGESPFGGFRFLNLLPKALSRRGRVRRWLSRVVQWSLGYDGYFQLYNVPFEHLPLFDYSEKKDLYQEGGINNGCPTVFDHFRSGDLPFHLSDWRKSENENLVDAGKAIETGGVRAVYLYMAELDGIMHAEGTRSPRVGDKLGWYERQLASLTERAREQYEHVRLHVFSDHGMTDVVATSPLAERVANIGLAFGSDYAAVYDSTMARFWFATPEAREAILDVLKDEPQGRILSDEELGTLGCDFDDQAFGEVFFLLDPGVVLDPSFMSSTPPAGMHGYDPSHPDSIALYATNRPDGIRPRGLSDLYTLMLRDSGLAA